ncbi:MAG: DUF1016 domain-containing protein [Nostoc indistinguendum CM1-VF10]|nr:DUF1016 domain-containing protein [Nostoc indistinguendum CM1-VF10]
MILNFLDLRDRYLEKGLEDGILWKIKKFLLELGAGFTFVTLMLHLKPFLTNRQEVRISYGS